MKYAIAIAALCVVAPAMAASPKTFTVKAGGTAIACRDAASIGQLSRLAREGDERAFLLGAFAKLKSGDCVDLDDGTAVTVEDIDEANSAICVKPSNGKAACVWTAPGNIDGLTAK